MFLFIISIRSDDMTPSVFIETWTIFLPVVG